MRMSSVFTVTSLVSVASVASVVVCGASFAACGGAPPPANAPVTPAVIPSAAPSAAASIDPTPALPPEPAGLTTIAKPASVCELAGKDMVTELAGRADGNPFVLAMFGLTTKITIAQGGSGYAEATTPLAAFRGLVPQQKVTVRPAHWFAFGGVYYPGASDTLKVRDAHDGKLVVVAPDTSPILTLNPENTTAEIACTDASLAVDANGDLARAAPALFAPSSAGKTKNMVLKTNKAIPISAEMDGPAMGSLDASDTSREVTLIETRGKRARIRIHHVTGWIDASLLSAPKPLSAREAALADALGFGMIGTVAGVSGQAGAPVKKPDATTKMSCTADARVVAEMSGTERYVAGSIPAGTAFRVGEKGADLSYLVWDSPSFLVRGSTRLAVPNRDLAACVADDSKPLPSAIVATLPNKPDAIDALDPQSGVLAVLGSGNGSSFQPGFGGLSGGGGGGPGGGSIGLGNIGTLGSGGSTGGRGTASAPTLRQGPTQVNGRLPPEVIQRIVRQNFGRFRLCYENGLRTNPTLSGRVSAKFVIDKNGNVQSTQDGGSDLPDQGVVSCVVRGFGNLSFPQPESGTVVVVYPIIFNPGAPTTK